MFEQREAAIVPQWTNFNIFATKSPAFSGLFFTGCAAFFVADMWYEGLLSIWSKDLACLFPLQNCNAVNKELWAVLDCRSEVQEQVNFIETMKEYLRIKTYNEYIDVYTFHMMSGKECLEIGDMNLPQGFQELKEIEILSFPIVLNITRRSYAPLCTSLYFSFIFLFNITDISYNNTNPMIKDIVDSENENKAHTRIFIIQTSESPNQVYSSMDFIHFTSSFKNLIIEDILDKICDLKPPDNNTLSYSRRSNVDIDYRIVNHLSNISSIDAYCYCVEKYGMQPLSLESYDEFAPIIQYINNASIHSGTNKVNIYFNDRAYDDFMATPTPGESCIYFNLSTNTDTILFHHKTMYNLGNYLGEIECTKTLQHTLIICEGKNVISEKYKEQFRQLYTTVPDIVALSHSFIFSFDFNYYLNKSYLNYECNFKTFTTGYDLGNYLCSDFSKKGSDSNVINASNAFITHLKKDQSSFYTYKKVDISKCEMYNECQTIPDSEINYYEISNPNVDIFCVDDINNKTFNDTCSIRTLNLNVSFEYFQCESDESQNSLKCIKDYSRQCKDKSHLQNCENFICPEAFIKCLNSFCIFHEMINDGYKDCPYGEDETILSRFVYDDYLCDGDLTVVLRDICLDLTSFEDFLQIIGNNTHFVCDHVCPKNYRCISSKMEVNFVNKRKNIIKRSKFINNISFFLSTRPKVVVSYEYHMLHINHLFFSIVSSNFHNCKLNNFDYEFQYWHFEELIMLDISYNNINHSNYLKSVETFSKLKLLNLSRNENLIIDQLFNFPRSLEIIDLSHTKIKALRNQVFGDLISLRHLNLSHTLITNFKDMGLPEYFTLDTLYIQFLKISNIDTDFFNGLTINSELIASDFVICCFQILNANISVEKCHAPIDLISSCKHLVGDTFKRIIIWLVGLSTIIGNGIVLVYKIGWNREIFKKAYGFFITGLAISDFFMGVYLIIIASVDAYYKDVYVLADFKWRNGFLCNICGFLSTLASETSTFFICLITLDRFLCITYPFGEHRFSKTSTLLSFTLVWFVGFVLALIPVVLSDWEIYSSNGLCLALPLSPTQNKGWIFSFVVFVGLNFALFFLIAFGQLIIFMNLIKIRKSVSNVKKNSQRRSQDMSVANKLAFVACTDFCCWFPVGILGFLSFNGYIFNREVYAWIAVFVLPINSALNPIIYTIPVCYSKC